MVECKKCGGAIPYGSYGNIKCEYCNTVNYVPLPQEEKQSVEKTPMKPSVEPSKQEKGGRGLIFWLIIIAIVSGTIGIFTYYPELMGKDTKKTYYYYFGTISTNDGRSSRTIEITCYDKMDWFSENDDVIDGEIVLALNTQQKGKLVWYKGVTYYNLKKVECYF